MSGNILYEINRQLASKRCVAYTNATPVSRRGIDCWYCISILVPVPRRDVLPVSIQEGSTATVRIM